MVLLTKTLWRKIPVVNGRKRFVTLYLKLLWYRVAFNQDIVKSQGTIFPPFPPRGNPRAFDCRPSMGRWGIWALPSESGEFEIEVSGISSGIQGGGRCRWGEEGLLKLYISLSFINLLKLLQIERYLYGYIFATTFSHNTYGKHLDYEITAKRFLPSHVFVRFASFCQFFQALLRLLGY